MKKFNREILIALLSAALLSLISYLSPVIFNENRLMQIISVFGAVVLILFIKQLIQNRIYKGDVKRLMDYIDKEGACKPDNIPHSLKNIYNSIDQSNNRTRELIGKFKTSAQQSYNIESRLSTNTELSLEKVKEIVTALNIVTEESDTLDNSINSVNASITNIFSNFNVLNEQISNQNLSLSRSSSAIEEMSASTESVLRITREKNSATDDLLALTNLGGDKLRFTDKIIEEISEQTDAMLQMITLIDDVATRTNLLAINASIEAAHAGEAGKGFAVVANEIRKLAENTSLNASKISETLNQITSKIIDAKEASNQSGETFSQILHKTKDVSNGLLEVSQNMEELSIGEKLILESTSELLNSSNQIDDMAYSIKEKIALIEDKMSDVEKTSSTSSGEIHTIHDHSIELNKIFIQGSTYLNQSLLNSEKLKRELDHFSDIKINQTDSIEVGIEWNNSLSVSNELIDNQHKGLIKGINDFLKMMVEDTGENEINQLLNRLGEYVVTHFNDEESYLYEMNYPDIENHKRIHRDFIAKLEDLKLDFKTNGASPILAAKIQKDVANWLINHISKEDMKYSRVKTGVS